MQLPLDSQENPQQSTFNTSVEMLVSCQPLPSFLTNNRKPLLSVCIDKILCEKVPQFTLMPSAPSTPLNSSQLCQSPQDSIIGANEMAEQTSGTMTPSFLSPQHSIAEIDNESRLGSSIKVCLLNVSIVNKLPSLHSFVYSSKMCFTETWLSDSFYDNEIFLSGYSVYRKDRCSRSGGVIVAVRDSISVSIFPSLNELEVVSVGVAQSPFY